MSDPAAHSQTASTHLIAQGPTATIFAPESDGSLDVCSQTNERFKRSHIAETQQMVLTRAAGKHGTEASDKAPVAIDKNAAALKSKKAKKTERARLEECRRLCYAAQLKREASAAASYIGAMKYLGESGNTWTCDISTTNQLSFPRFRCNSRVCHAGCQSNVFDIRIGSTRSRNRRSLTKARARSGATASVSNRFY
jgi:hypothetical protein